MIKDIARACRSYRRFYENERIPRELLVDWVDTARIVASSANGQPLRYLIVDDPQGCAELFPNTAWAGPSRTGRAPGKASAPAPTS